MKVLISVDTYLPYKSGVVTSVVNLKNELIKQKNEVYIVTPSNRSYSYRDGNIFYIKSFSVNKLYPNLRMGTKFNHKIVKDLIKIHPDIVHSQTEAFSFDVAKKVARACNVPLVHTCHTIYEYYTANMHIPKVIGNKAVKLFNHHILKNVDHIIVPSVKMEKIVEGYISNKKISIVPTGLDLTLFNQKINPKEQELLKRQLNIMPDERILISLGRLSLEKRIEEIMEYTSLLDTKVTLLIVGDGPDKENLMNLASNYANFKTIFTGQVSIEQVPLYMSLGEIFVNASISETQGLTYAEALASSLAVVAREDECLIGQVKSGYNGYTFKSASEYKDIIEKLLNDKALLKKIQTNAKISSNKLSVNIFGKNVLKIYQEEIKAKKIEQ